LTPLCRHVASRISHIFGGASDRNWLVQRSEQVQIKGKGSMTTFWCEPYAQPASTPSVSNSSKSDFQAEFPNAAAPDVFDRLVEWNVDLFAVLLKGIVTKRLSSRAKQSIGSFDLSHVSLATMGKPVDEIVEFIDLSEAGASFSRLPGVISVPPVIVTQLRLFIEAIARQYQANPFHNFEHASHVVMSTKKLLDRISESIKEVKEASPPDAPMLTGIMFDPLTQFAILFAALIHDVDHPGVSNAQLVVEQDSLATTYNGKSVAEQNSIDVAWSILMRPEYEDLQGCIFATHSDYARFRQIVVNIVLATDLFDRDLKIMREIRWNKAFAARTEPVSSNSIQADSRPRATIIMELIIQASDVSHTMQHFTVYKKWNMCLLTEMYEAFASGRTTKDPLDGWYEGELWFFDNYIIPLAQKLRECSVFGVACDEFLDYAKDNRLEWEVKGRNIVQEAANSLRLREHMCIKPSPAKQGVENSQKPSAQTPAGTRLLL
jgi:3'5'-cyclic nucleotide phosphodiesterase